LETFWERLPGGGDEKILKKKLSTNGEQGELLSQLPAL
jgi:hypothetical protein